MWYLKQYQVDLALVATVLDNEPKKVLQSLSSSNAEDFFEAVNNGNLAWIRDNMVQQTGYDADARHIQMKLLVDGLKGSPVVSMKDLCAIYNYTNHKNHNVNTFGKLAAGYLPAPKAIRSGGKRVWGVTITWN